jgi:hypothetical protein
MLGVSSGFWRPYYSTNGTGSLNWVSSFTVDDAWQHILLVYDATVPEFKISKNGGSFQSSGTLGNPLHDTTVPLAIGGYFTSTLAATGAYRGAYDQTAYFDVALTLSQGQYIYNSGSGRAYSGWSLE